MSVSIVAGEGQATSVAKKLQDVGEGSVVAGGRNDAGLSSSPAGSRHPPDTDSVSFNGCGGAHLMQFEI